MQLRGVAEWGLAVKAITEEMDRAVQRSVREGALTQKRMVRSSFGGAPRWGMDNHSPQPRGGGPGIKTGRLEKSVGYTPIQRVSYGHYSTWLKARRIYANKVEGLYPYFTPKVRESQPVLDGIFYRNYLSVVSKSI